MKHSVTHYTSTVETMLKLYKDLPKSQTPHGQEFLKCRIAATDRQTNALRPESTECQKRKPESQNGGKK